MTEQFFYFPFCPSSLLSPCLRKQTVPQWDDPSPAAFWGKTAEHWSPTRYCKQNNFLRLAAIFILLHWANFDNDSKSFSMKQMAYIIVAVQCASTVGVFTRSSATKVNLLSSSTSYGSHRHSFGLLRIALGKHYNSRLVQPEALRKIQKHVEHDRVIRTCK